MIGMSPEQQLAYSDLTPEQRMQIEEMVKKRVETTQQPMRMCKTGCLCIVGLGLIIVASIMWAGWIKEYTRPFETASCVVLAKRRDVWKSCSRSNCPDQSTGVYTVRVTPDLRKTNQGSEIEAFEKSSRDESVSGDRALYDSIAVNEKVNCYQATDDPEIVKLTDGPSAKLTSFEMLLPLIIVIPAIFVVLYAAASNLYQVFGGDSYEKGSLALDNGEGGYSSED